MFDFAGWFDRHDRKDGTKAQIGASGANGEVGVDDVTCNIFQPYHPHIDPDGPIVTKKMRQLHRAGPNAQTCGARTRIRELWRILANDFMTYPSSPRPVDLYNRSFLPGRILTT